MPIFLSSARHIWSLRRSNLWSFGGPFAAIRYQPLGLLFNLGVNCVVTYKMHNINTFNNKLASSDVNEGSITQTAASTSVMRIRLSLLQLLVEWIASPEMIVVSGNRTLTVVLHRCFVVKGEEYNRSNLQSHRHPTGHVSS